MSLCDVCGKSCDCSKGDIIKCSGSCGSLCHLACIKDDFANKKTRSGREWKCKNCRPSSAQGGNSGAVEESTKDFLFTLMQDFKNEVVSELKPFRMEMAELSAAVKFISDKLDTSNCLMEDIKKEMAAVKKENIELRIKNENLTGEVDDLKERLRSLEQYTRKNNLEVSGIPVTAQENICAIIKDVGVALGVEIRENQIAAAHRIPSFNQDRNPSIVVQFISRSTRDSILTNYRERKSLNANQVNSSFRSQKVYINEHLSPANKLLLAKLKQKAREAGYAYVWVRDGKFFIRKSAGERCIKISSYEEFNKIK